MPVRRIYRRPVSAAPIATWRCARVETVADGCVDPILIFIKPRPVTPRHVVIDIDQKTVESRDANSLPDLRKFAVIRPLPELAFRDSKLKGGIAITLEIADVRAVRGNQATLPICSPIFDACLTMKPPPEADKRNRIERQDRKTASLPHNLRLRNLMFSQARRPERWQPPPMCKAMVGDCAAYGRLPSALGSAIGVIVDLRSLRIGHL